MIITIDTDAEVVRIKGFVSFSDLLDFSDYAFYDIEFEQDDSDVVIGKVETPFTESNAT
jgi:hypothetical protein